MTTSPTRRVPVCHLITELNIGGAERALWKFLKFHDQQRYRVHVGCLYGPGPVAEQIRALGIDVTDMRMTSKLRLDALLRVRSWLRQHSPQILHGWMFHANMIARVCGRSAGVPHILISRRNENLSGLGRDRINRWTQRLSHRTIAVSESVRQAEIDSTGCDPRCVVTVPNGIDLASIPEITDQQTQSVRADYDIPADAIVVGTAARFRPQKGLTDFVEAVARLHDQHPRVVALVVGDGPQWNEVQSLVDRLKLQSVFRFTGLQSEPAKLIATMDVFALSSRWEGMPNVVLEAMAMRVPVVSTHVGGAPELIDAPQGGRLVPPRQPDKLAAAIGELVSMPPADRKAIGAAGFQRVATQFTLQSSVKRTEAVYEELLAESPM